MKAKIINILYNVYSFLFIFTMINREFLLLGLDLRFVVLPLGLVLLFLSFFNRDQKQDYYDKNGKLIIIFYIYVFISNISWIWNGIEINKTKFINEIILISNIFISILVFYRYKKYVKQEQLNRFIVISAILLMISMILVSCGFSLKEISGSPDVSYIYVQSEKAPDHKNLFGGGYRPAGYASDPNYATLLLLIACIATLKLKIKKVWKIPFIILFSVGIGLACSKTILAACILGIIVTLIYKFTKPNDKLIKAFNFIFIFGVICINIFVIKIPVLKQYMPSTLTTRFVMWESADELLHKSPIIGNGITSFRSYFKLKNRYVHSHSTYWQILSELGIVGILLYGKILYNLLNKNKEDKLGFFIIFVYIIYAMTYETIAMQFIAYILYIMNIKKDNRNIGKKALFMINTLSNGGAERVCINMADELVKEGYDVDFILLNNKNIENDIYDINSKIRIYNLGIEEKNKIKKVIKIVKSIKLVDKIIQENEIEEKYSLITSHLPMSNILTRLSIVRNKAIYVFHSNIEFYDENRSFIFKIFFRMIYKNKKLVTVSNGVKEECINIYGLNKDDVRTIYNPIDIKKIEEQKKEEISIKDKYFLHVGRLSKEKRQDKMIDIFYKGKFYNEYKLILCGCGELEKELKEQVRNLKIEDKVIFLGWQCNIYKWMSHCDVLISTSDKEAFSMVLIEALACGAKVVASNCDGPKEILIGEYEKYLVKKDDITGYIKTIKECISESTEKPSYNFESFMPEYNIKMYIEFYNN